jgi:hypothetical protein
VAKAVEVSQQWQSESQTDTAQTPPGHPFHELGLKMTGYFAAEKSLSP